MKCKKKYHFLHIIISFNCQYQSFYDALFTKTILKPPLKLNHFTLTNNKLLA
jgi:hypothetical protein